jgi:ATP-dependent protease ClpP protease subunit
MTIEKKNDFELDKYKSQPIRFSEKGDHYELVFTDDFIVPSSGVDGLKQYTIITDVLMDMRNADHDKELHIFIGSYGGMTHALNMILQQVLEFKHRVAINLGMADSAGWMLTFACQERYGSPFSEYVYHEMFCVEIGRNKEIRNANTYAINWWKELLDRTDTRKVLTDNELKLGETSDVWFTGADLIKRGAVMDYSKYVTRTVPTKCDNCYNVGDSIYVKEGDEYILCKKDYAKRLSYNELVMHGDNDGKTDRKKKKGAK